MSAPETDLLFLAGRVYAAVWRHNAPPPRDRYPVASCRDAPSWRDCVALWRLHENVLWFAKAPRPLLRNLGAKPSAFLERRRWSLAHWLSGEFRLLRADAPTPRLGEARIATYHPERTLHVCGGKHFLSEHFSAFRAKAVKAEVIPHELPGIAAEEWPFLRAIRAQADEVLPPLIYADWLEEQGDLRSEFVRLKDRLASRLLSDAERRRLRERFAVLAKQVNNPLWMRLMDYPTAAPPRFICWWKELSSLP